MPDASFSPAPLPYAEDALDPALSCHAIELHYGRHHKSYADRLNRLLANDPMRLMPLSEVIATSRRNGVTSVFNAAAQLDNHDRFWASLHPTGTEPTGAFATALTRSFGGKDEAILALRSAGLGHFASGWVWLVSRNGRLAVETTGNADTPVGAGADPLLVIDLWEHAYYPDYENRRQAYLDAIIQKLDWAAASRRFENVA